jgi:hypothetical protein
MHQLWHKNCILQSVNFFNNHPTQENLMAKTVADVMKMVKENEVKFVDFRFTDTRGKEQHVTVPVSHLTKTSSRPAMPSTVRPSPAGRALKPRTCS